MTSKPTPRPNTRAPFGLKVGVGPATQPSKLTKVTDNSKGWALVANIPVPPTSEARSFKGKLNLIPVLVNGGIIPDQVKEPEVTYSAPKEEETPLEEEHSRGGPPPTFTAKANKEIEILWFGAKLVLPCLNAIRYKTKADRGGQEWVMLELAVNQKTGTPTWQPPIAQLDEDGRIVTPEFQCVLDGVQVTCQVLNIEIYDPSNQKYVIVLRVVG